MHSPAQRHHSLIAGHPPAHGKKRAHNMIKESDCWTATSDSLNFDFNEDFLKELDISNIEFTLPSNPSTIANSMLPDLSDLYSFDDSSSSALSSAPSTPPPTCDVTLPAVEPLESLVTRSAAETIQELHDESHVKRLELREQMDAEKGTRTAYPCHYSRYLFEWSLDQDQRLQEDPTRARIDAEPHYGDKSSSLSVKRGISA